jgi:filamentous hemagglutinin family protein
MARQLIRFNPITAVIGLALTACFTQPIARAHPTAGSAHTAGKIGGTAPAVRLPMLNPLPLHQPKARTLTVKNSTPIAKPADQAPTVSAITADTTLGPGYNTMVNPTSNPNGTTTYTITGGKLVGQNAFESFTQFTVGTNDIAQFQIPASNGNTSINNILVRVTGNQQSTIDGTIQTVLSTDGITPHPATFYLINPAGIIFSENANLNVGGGLVFSTANELSLGGSGVFAATNPSSSSLTAGSPMTLGFSTPSPSPITVYGYVVGPEDSLLVAAGNITVNGGELANSGNSSAAFVSVGSSGALPLSNPLSGSFSAMGNVTVSNGGFLGSYGYNDASGNAGAVTVAAASVTVDGFYSAIASSSSGGNSGTLALTSSDAVSVTAGGFIGSDASYGVNSSSVTIITGSVSVDSLGGFGSEIASRSGTGTAGPLLLTASGALAATGGGFIGSDAKNGTNSGAVTVTAASASVGSSSGSGSEIATRSGAGGASGQFVLNSTGVVNVTGGGFVGSDAVLGTSSSQVTVNAGSVNVDGYNGDVDSELASRSGTGAAGPVSLSVIGSISVTNGAFLGSDAYPSNSVEGTSSSTVTVNARSVSVDGADNNYNISELADRCGTGTAGTFNMTVSGDVSVTNGGFLGSTGGPTVINAGSVRVDGANDFGDFSTLGSSSLTFARGGDGGNAGTLNLTASGTVSATAGGIIGSVAIFGASGAVVVSAGSVTVDGSGSAGVFSADSEIGSRSGGGEGAPTVPSAAGLVQLSAAGAISLTNGGFIGSDGHNLGGFVNGTNSSDVVVHAGSLIIEGSDVNGNVSELASRAGTGTAGSLEVDVPGSIVVSNSGFLSSDASTGTTSGLVALNAGSIAVNSGGTVETAAGSKGVASSVAVIASQVIINGQGSTLPTGIFVSGDLPHDLPQSGSDLSIQATQSLTVTDASITADAFGASRAGKLVVSSPIVSLASDSSISARSYNGGAGNGTIQINAQNIDLSTGSSISADNYRGTQSGGAVDINAASVTLSSGSLISATAGAGLAEPLTVSVDFAGLPGGLDGAYGDLYLVSPTGKQVQLYSVLNTSVLDSATFSDTPTTTQQLPVGFLSAFIAKDLDGSWNLIYAGSRNPFTSSTAMLNNWSLSLGGVQIGKNNVPQTGSDFTSTIKVSGVSPGLTGGQGGDVNIVSGSVVSVSGGSQITAETLGTGLAGNVNITAPNILALQRYLCSTL